MNAGVSLNRQALCYVRWAPYEDRDPAMSESAQRDALRGYCAMRQLAVAAWFEDTAQATSGWEQRPGAQALSARLAHPEAPRVLVCYSLDRLTTSPTRALERLSAWRAQGVEVHVVSMGGQPVELMGMMGPWFIAALEGFSRMEQLHEREHVQHELTLPEAPRLSREQRGSIPYGYKLDPEGVFIIEAPEEQRALRYLMTLHRAGYSMRRIATKLTEEGYAPRGERWHVTTVARLIRRMEEDEA